MENDVEDRFQIVVLYQSIEWLEGNLLLAFKENCYIHCELILKHC